MEYGLAFVVFILFFVALSIGLLFKNKPLQGSCGGVNKLMGNSKCSLCGGNVNACENQQQQ